MDLEKIGYLDFHKLKIGVIGDCMLDIYHYGEVERISPEAPVPIFKQSNNEPEYRLGGACNTALNLSKLGVQTTLFGFVGYDMGASYMATYLNENNIVNRTFPLSGFPTITKNRYFSKNQQLIRIDQENSDGEIYDRGQQEKVIDEIVDGLKDFDALILSDYGKGALYHPVLNTIMSHCHENVPIFVDPKITDWSHYQNAFCITPNWTEFIEACHIPKMDIEDEKAIISIAQDKADRYGFNFLLLTMGSKGMILTNDANFSATVPAEAVEIYDVSGAGDTVIAVLAAAYCKDYPMTVGMQLASMAAEIVIGKLGTYAITNFELNSKLSKCFNKEKSNGIQI